MPDQLVDHVHHCSHCRGALLVLATELGGSSLTPVDRPCEAIEDQIAMFVDYERRYGLVAATQTFPDVWWHMLVCPDCDQFYAEVCELADLPAEPWQAAALPVRLQPQPLFQPQPQPQPLFQLRLRPTLVRQLMNAERRLGVAWGNKRSDLLITEQETELSRLRLYLRRPSPSELVLVVRTEPALAGTAVLTVAAETYSAALDGEGSAVFANLGVDLFSADQAIALTVTTA